MWDESKCDLCGDCLAKCRYVDYDKERAAAEIKLLMEGKDADILHKCITCIACNDYCPTGADPSNLIFKMQEKMGTCPLVVAGKPALDGIAQGLEGKGDPIELIPGDPDKPALSICTMEYHIPEGALDGQLFWGMTVVKGGDYYCLIGWEHSGKESPIERYAQRFIDNLTSLGKNILLLHDDCCAMVHAKVRDYGINVPFNYMHLFEYLRNYLRDHKSNITKLGKKVAYQQPYTSRYTPEKNAFLDEIFQLVGVERPSRKYE